MANDTYSDPPRGIAGLTGREPIGAALTVGIKGANGAPTEKDRFHILDASASEAEFQKRDGGTYKAPVRVPHPAFAVFNGAGPDRRRVVQARLAHARINDLFEYRLQCAKSARIPAHPGKAPVCQGDGRAARRWDGHQYLDIPCPGERCEFSQPGPPDRSGRPSRPDCGPWMRFLARFDFPATARKLPDGTDQVVRLPAITFKLTSGSWNTVRNFLGFFDAFRAACAGFGVDPNAVPLFGLPVLLTLSEKTNSEAKSRFPVVGIQVAGDADIISWIEHQMQRRQDLVRLATVQPLALTDSALQRPDVINADYETVSGPALSVPSAK